ncbi:MAG: rRNA maturation RNase YbeY [candidate division WOR-3 bacterium]|nr:rRNA maturation RNase YbeY [candidate division WOR-3 bacterium]
MGSPNRRNKLQLCIFGTRDRRLKQEISRLLHRLQPVITPRLPPGEINIIFVSNRKITELNRRFLGRNRPTDVLSFPLTQVRTGPGCGWVVGEIYISREQARLQAKAAGIRLHTELLQLVRHGLLHLAGFSHREMNRLP